MNQIFPTEQTENDLTPIQLQKPMQMEDGTKIKFLFAHCLVVDKALCLWSMFTVAITAIFIDFDVNYDGQVNLLWINFFITLLVLIPLIIIRHSIFLNLRQEQQIISKYVKLSDYKYEIIIECLIMFLMPLPFLNSINIQSVDLYDKVVFDFQLNHFLAILAWTRTYVVIRSTLIHSVYCSPRSSRICRMYGNEADYWFAVKSIFKEQPVNCTCVILLISIVVGSFTIKIAETPLYSVLAADEIPNSMNFSYFINSMWNVIATMTTVGYGDFFPRTLYGRALNCLIAIWGIFCVSLMTVVLQNLFQLDTLEKRALTVLNRLSLRNNVMNNAANLIKDAIRIKLKNVNKDEFRPVILSEQEKKKVKQQDSYLKSQSVVFKTIHRNLKELSESDNIEDQMQKSFDLVKEDLGSLLKNQELLKQFIEGQLTATFDQMIEREVRPQLTFDFSFQ